MASPFLLFIRFFSNFFIAYIFPLILLWHAQTCNQSNPKTILLHFQKKASLLICVFFFITKYHSPLQIHPSLILCSGGMSSLWQVVCEKITQLRFRIYTVGSTLHDYSMISLIILDNLLSILLWSKPFKIVHD